MAYLFLLQIQEKQSSLSLTSKAVFHVDGDVISPLIKALYLSIYIKITHTAFLKDYFKSLWLLLRVLSAAISQVCSQRKACDANS